MTAQKPSTSSAIRFYPIERRIQRFAGEPVFVNIGGDPGKQSIEFKERLPKRKGRVIFQYLPGEIEHAVSQGLPDGVEVMVHDLYTPQVIKGEAKYYDLPAILQEHLDDKAILILKNIIQTMEKDSLILLDKMVLQNQNIDWFATSTDLAMLAALSSMERTEAQWRNLLEGLGFKV